MLQPPLPNRSAPRVSTTLTARFKRYRESFRRNPAARNRAGIPEEKVKKMDQNQLLQSALEQSARDYGCAPGDFLRQDPVVILSEPHEGARVYLPLPIACSLVSYGNNVVAQTSEPLLDKVLAFLRRYPAEHCFETPNLYVLNDILAPYGQKLCFMGEYFLPDLSRLQELPCSCRVKLLTPEDFAGLYLPQWSNALCEKRRERDVLAVGAYDGETLVGLAGASADCDSMYQIGIDVLPAYRRQGIASALTSRLTLEILALGKVPFYCAAWSNIRSVRNALHCGFSPAWAEISSRSAAFIDQLNNE